MGKFFLLVRANVRKAKGQTATLAVVLLIAALMLQIGMMLALDYSKNFDARAELTNSEDVIFSYQTRDRERIDRWEQIIREDPRTAKLETENSLCNVISFLYGSGEMNTHCIILPADTEREIGRFRFVEKTAAEGNVIYLPYIFKMSGGYKTGETFHFNIQTKRCSYTIGGFYEHAMVGSVNGGISSFLLARPAFDKLEAETDIGGVMFSVKLHDRAQSDAYYSEVGNRLNVLAHDLVFNGGNYSFIKSSRTLTANICAMIFLGIALMITAIALVITAFRISNSIEEDMRVYGTLQSIGYTSGQIIRSVLLQFLLVGILGALTGICASYAVLPLINNLLVMQTGVIWTYGFQPAAAAAVLLLILGTVAATAYLAAAKLKRLRPITALRGGVATHSFKRNPFPLDSARGNVNFLLAVKSACRNVKQNLAMFLIVGIVSFACVFMSVMLQTFTIDMGQVMGFLAGEQADVGLYTSAEDADAFYDALSARPEVKRAYRYQSMLVMFEGVQLAAYIVDDCDNLNNPEVLYAGRFPKFPNEIALGGKIAQEKGVAVGDTVTLRLGDDEAAYLVSGLTQSSNYLGKECTILSAGYERLHAEPLPGGFYVLLQEGRNINGFLEAMTAEFGETILVSINIREVVASVMGTFSSMVSMLVAAFTAVLLAVVALVLYLMIKTFILRKHRDYGVEKALGYTTGNLILQTALGFMPVVIAATLLGVLLGVFSMNPLLTLLFSGIGIMKAMFPVPPGITVAFAAVIILFSFAVAAAVSLRVRRISPQALINE